MENTPPLYLCCLVSAIVFLANCEIPTKRHHKQGNRWSHGCRGIPGLNQTVNTLRCPVDCTIAIHQVTYGTKNRPGCPYEISHPVEPHCCQREVTDDCFQDKSQKIPMLQLLCREASNVCELSVDRVAIRCPRNAFSISTMRSILYSCVCATPPTTVIIRTDPPTVTETEELPASTRGNDQDVTRPSIGNSTLLPHDDDQDLEITAMAPLSRSQPLSTLPSVEPLNPTTTRSTRRHVGDTGDPTPSTPNADIEPLSISTSAVNPTVLQTTTTTTPPVATTTTTTPWTLTAENQPTEGIDSTADTKSRAEQLPPAETESGGEGLNGPLLGGIVGGAAMIFVISILAIVILCVRRKRRKSEAQGTEEASQYAYEIMDISLRRPQPVVTQGPEITPCETTDEPNDINLEGQTTQGTFLEKQIQRYLITSIYAEIKDFKRRSQESTGNGDVIITPPERNVTTKPTPKPRRICDLYAKVNKQTGKHDQEKRNSHTDKICKQDSTRGQSSETNYPTSFANCDDLYDSCESAPPARSAETTAQPLTTTYDKLMSCDTKNCQNDRAVNRAASGPYDELYTTKMAQDTETLERIRYFDNCEYATLNVTNGQMSWTSNKRSSACDGNY